MLDFEPEANLLGDSETKGIAPLRAFTYAKDVRNVRHFLAATCQVLRVPPRVTGRSERKFEDLLPISELHWSEVVMGIDSKLHWNF
jgi:hypothetical protein